MPLNQPAAPDFSDPVGLLEACHGRILGHCALLERILAWLPAHGADDEVRSAARKVAHYFATAAPHHHADEEQDLFRLLAGKAGLDPVLAALSAEHAELDAAWARLAGALGALAEGRVERDLAAAVRDFNARYRAHIELENGRVLPAARQHLTADDCRALGRSMARRRGVSPEGSHDLG